MAMRTLLSRVTTHRGRLMTVRALLDRSLREWFLPDRPLQGLIARLALGRRRHRLWTPRRLLALLLMLRALFLVPLALALLLLRRPLVMRLGGMRVGLRL